MTEIQFPIKEVEQALHKGEFCFYYQPKVSFLSGRIVGAEALLRWTKPDGTVIMPAHYLPLAEETGFITDISAVMLPQLIEDIEALRAIKSDIQVAYNISARDLDSPYLVKMLRSYIGGKRINPGNIQIEITETAVLGSDEHVRQGLHDLVALGIEIAMDDFGTGYSSLDILSRFPFSIIKFDQGVVRRMADDARNTHIIRSSLHLARDLSLKTVAEGVEDRGTYVFLMASGCDEAQGYWISKAIPREDFVSLFNEAPSWPSSSLGLLYNAWVNHITYRRKVLDAVHSMSLTKTEEWAKLPKTDLSHSPARCRLSMWYLGEDPEDKDTPELNGLEEPHRLMHASGERLIKSVQENEGPEAVKKALRVFLDYSDVVDANVSLIVQRWLSETLDVDN